MNELYRHGVKGQKLGVRRYQNPDGSLTSAGQKRLSKSIIKDYKKTNHATTDRINYKDRQVSNLRKSLIRIISWTNGKNQEEKKNEESKH